MENYYQHLPIRLMTGILWYAHRTPSTIYAMAKAIIQLCPHSPTAPLPVFQSLSPKQKEGIYQESKGYCFPCQHLNHSRGASSNAFTVFYAAATALEMPV
jgi:hypothetical protein